MEFRRVLFRSPIAYNNTATANVNAGTLRLTGGGTDTGSFNIGAGTTLDLNSGTHHLNNITTAGAGTFQISGSTGFNFVNVNGGTYPTLLLISGGKPPRDGATVTRPAPWTGGTLTPDS